MECFKEFSNSYANGIIATSALGTLILATITLLYLKKEYSQKYRAYVFPIVHTVMIPGGHGFTVSIIPQNIGSHPCKAKMSQIRLHIGDETYETPDTKDWLLLASHTVGMQMPIGHVNDLGVLSIREGRYRNNRIEVSFVLCTMSIDEKFKEKKSFAFEINVLSENPQVQFRPEWIETV